MHLANAIYVDSKFQLQEEFLSKCQEQFETTVAKMIAQNGAESVKQINQWIEEKTKNKISYIINSGIIVILIENDKVFS